MLPQRWWCLSSHNLAKWVVFSGKLYLSSLLTVHIMCTNYIEQSALRYAFFMINVFTIYWYLQEMDTRQFYGRKEHDRVVRVIPSDSEDSELEESENEDSEVEESHEDWIPESGLRDSLEVRGQLGVSQQSIMCVCVRTCVCVCLHACHCMMKGIWQTCFWLCPVQLGNLHRESCATPWASRCGSKWQRCPPPGPAYTQA